MTALLGAFKRYVCTSRVSILQCTAAGRHYSWFSKKEVEVQTTDGADEQQKAGSTDSSSSGGFTLSESELKDAKKQLSSMGVDDSLLQKMMGDPALTALMAKPSLQAKMLEMKQNPASAFKHMADPDVRQALSALMALAPGLAKGMK